MHHPTTHTHEPRTATGKARSTGIAIAGVVLLVALTGGAGGPAATHAQGGPFDGLERKHLVDWVAVGAVTPHSAAVNVRVRGDAREVKMMASRHRTFLEPIPSTSSRANDSVADRVVRLEWSGLVPNTRYFYVLLADGKIDNAGRGSFRTPPLGPSSLRMAVGADVSPSGKEHEVFRAIRDLDPHLFLVVGDLFDIDHIRFDDPEQVRIHWRLMRRSRSLLDLLLAVPLAYIWDDHDYGKNDGDRTMGARRSSRIVYQEHVPHYPLALKDGSSPNVPIAQAFSIGRVRFILTDLRSERAPNKTADGPDKSMLGPAQRAWFEAELRAASARNELVIWASSVPWTAAPQAGADHWGGFATERTRVAALVAELQVPLVIVSGDEHTVAIDDGRHGDYAPGGGAPIPVIHTGALAAVGKGIKGGPYSHGNQPNRNDHRGNSIGDGQFVTLDVTDFGGTRICLKATGWRLEGDSGRLVRLRRQGAGLTGEELSWSTCWTVTSAPGVYEHRLFMPLNNNLGD